MPKRGTVREDGMVLLRTKKGKEIWGTQEQWEKFESWRISYMNKRREAYRTKTTKKWKIGEYNPENGLYFIRNSGNYTPMFGTKDKVDEYIKQRRKIKVDYVQRMNLTKIPATAKFGIHRKRGDFEPILNLYFWKYNYLSCEEIWLTKEKFDHYWKKDSLRRKRKSLSTTTETST